MKLSRPLLGILIVHELAKSSVQACSICFGSGNPDMARGFYWGIMILMLLPMALMAMIGGGIFLSLRKRKMTAQNIARVP